LSGINALFYVFCFRLNLALELRNRREMRLKKYVTLQANNYVQFNHMYFYRIRWERQQRRKIRIRKGKRRSRSKRKR